MKKQQLKNKYIIEMSGSGWSYEIIDCVTKNVVLVLKKPKDVKQEIFEEVANCIIKLINE